MLDARRIQGIYQQPFSGHYFQIDVEGEVLRSRSLWNEVLHVPHVALGETRVDFITGPQQQALLLWTRGFRKQGTMVQIAVAEELDAMLAAMRGFRLRLAAWSLALLFLHQLLEALRLLAFSSLLDLLHLDVGFHSLVGFFHQA